MKYYTTPIFAIGIPNKIYSGYRAMTLDEFNENKINITNHYNYHKTFTKLDDICYTWLSIDTHQIIINSHNSYISYISNAIANKNFKIIIFNDKYAETVNCINNLNLNNGKTTMKNLSTLFICDYKNLIL
jgi:hypothetical protein